MGFICFALAIGSLIAATIGTVRAGKKRLQPKKWWN